MLCVDMITANLYKLNKSHFFVQGQKDVLQSGVKLKERLVSVML